MHKHDCIHDIQGGCNAGSARQSIASMKSLATKCASCCLPFGPYSLLLTLLFISFVASSVASLHGFKLQSDHHQVCMLIMMPICMMVPTCMMMLICIMMPICMMMPICVMCAGRDSSEGEQATEGEGLPAADQ